MSPEPNTCHTVALGLKPRVNLGILEFFKGFQRCNIFLFSLALSTILSPVMVGSDAAYGADLPYVEKAARGCAPLKLGAGTALRPLARTGAADSLTVKESVVGKDIVVGDGGVHSEVVHSELMRSQASQIENNHSKTAPPESFTTPEIKDLKGSKDFKESSSTVSKIKGKVPGLYFVCERQLALKGKRISASDWFGKTSKSLSYGDRGATADSLYSEDILIKRLSEEMESSGRPLTIFVHGCCVSFSENLIQANDIHQALQAQGLNGPLLAYDWATPNYNYAGSLRRLPGCRTNFTAFLDRLVSKLGREKIVIVAHSLGIHALQGYCQHALKQEPEPKQIFSAVVLCRPDVDVSSFKHSEEAVKLLSGKLMLLCATNDINLKLSSFIRRAGYNFGDDPKPRHGNHLRLGQASVAGTLAGNIAVYDISPLKLKHLIPYKLIASLLTGECSAFSIEQAQSGLLHVKNR